MYRNKTKASTVVSDRNRWQNMASATGRAGVWGAFSEIPEKKGSPATLGYSVWALTMVPCVAVTLHAAVAFFLLAW